MHPTRMQRLAMTVTKWIGSTQSVFVHTVIFAIAIYILVQGLFSFDIVILVLNTAVSLEAIYLALFIQMTVNFQSVSIAEVEKDIDEMQEDVGEIQEDIDEIQEDVDELQEDVEDIEESDNADERRKLEQKQLLSTIQADIQKLLTDLDRAKKTETTVSVKTEPSIAKPAKRAKKKPGSKPRAKVSAAKPRR